MSDNLKIGERLKLLRERHLESRKFRQVEFAEKLGVDRDKISRIENGKQAIDLNLLISIGQEFNVDLHWLITGESFKSKAEEQLEACAEKLGKLNYYVERLELLINKN
jgi:transcriptional regulator with XRE-family HTH domain